MSNYQGDYLRGDAVDLWWSSANSLGASANPSSNGTVFVCVSNTSSGNTQVGVTLTTGIFTGTHCIRISTGSATGFYLPERNYAVVISAFTIDGQLVTREIGSFSIENRYESGLILRTTLTGANASGVTLGTNASSTTSTYEGGTIFLSDNTGKQQAREIVTYFGSNQSSGVDRAWTTQPANGSTARIFAGSLPSTTAEIGNAIWASVRTSNVTTGTFGEGVPVAPAGINVSSISTAAFTGSMYAASSLNSMADALINRSITADSKTTRLVKEALAAIRNKVDATGSVGTVYDRDDTTSLFTFSTATGAFPFSKIAPGS